MKSRYGAVLACFLGFFSVAQAETYVMPEVTAYTAPEGYFAHEITFHNTSTGWGLIEVIANNKTTSCGRRCTLTVPTIAFDYGELVNQYSYIQFFPVDFIKQYSYQHTGHQLMMLPGWRLYLMPGDYTLYVWGTAQFASSSYRVQVKPANDPKGED